MKQSKICFLAAICIAIVVLIPATVFAAKKENLETTKAILEKAGQANDVGEFLAAYTKLGKALDKVPDKVKKAKGFFDKAIGPLNAANDAVLLYKYIGDYKNANAKTKGDIGEKVAQSFFDLISPAINATPQGALINISLQIGKMCQRSMMDAVAQYQFSQAQQTYEADVIIQEGTDANYIDRNSPWFDLVCWLRVDKVKTSEIFTKVTRLEQLDPDGKYSKLALACYNDGATVDQIYDVVSALVEIDKLNERAKQLKNDAETLAKFRAEEEKKKADAQRLAAQAKAAAAQAKANNQKNIQGRCKFSDPAGVWKAIDTHKFANALYQVWANSYPTPLLASKPKNKTDKEIIQERCKFGNQQDVWNAVAKHPKANDLLKAWADSYYQGLR